MAIDQIAYTNARMEELQPRLTELGNKSDLTEDERTEFDGTKAEWTKLDERRTDLVERKRIADLAGKATFTINTNPDPFKVDTRALSRSDAIGAARTVVEQVQSRFRSDSHAENVTRLIDRCDGVGETVSRLALTTGSDEYREQFMAYMTQRSHDAGLLERANNEYRAMTAGTGNSGGYMVPLMLDPSMTITGAGSYNPFRRVAAVKTINTLIYNGATAAQVTAGILSENAAFADNAPVVGQVQITTYKYGAYIPASFEAFEDIDALAADVGELFQDAKDNVEASQMVTGTGSAPHGVVASVGAVTASRVSPATGGAYAVADVYSVHSGLPARFWYSNPASKAWVMNVPTIDKTRQFATANNYHGFLTDLAGGQPAQLLGDQLIAASAMSSSYTTGQDVVLYGDFSRYYIVDRIGVSVEFIPNVFDQATGRPSGTRAWLMHWRWGADVADANAFRLLRL